MTTIIIIIILLLLFVSKSGYEWNIYKIYCYMYCIIHKSHTHTQIKTST